MSFRTSWLLNPSMDHLTPEQRTVYDNIVNGPRGEFAEAYTGLLLNPSIGDIVQQLGAYLRFESTLPKRLSQFAALVTVRHWNNDLEWHFLPAAVLANGTPQHVIDSVAARTRPDFDDEAEAVVYDFTTEALNSGPVSDPTYQRAVETFGEEGVFELIAVVGHFSFFSFQVNAFKHDLPAGAVPLPR